MRRTAHVLVVLVTGWFLLLPPVAEAAHDQPARAGVVLAQEPAPNPAPAPPDQGADQARRNMIGAAGAVLIALVLFTRKRRGLPIVDFKWKKKE